MALNPLDILIVFLPLSYLLTHLREGFWPLTKKIFTIIVGLALLLYAMLFSPIASQGVRIEESKLGSLLIKEVATVESAIYSLRVSTPESGLTLPFKPTSLTLDTKSEEVMLNLINEERKKAGLGELQLDERLAVVARKHSLDMWQRQYFAHDTPEGVTPFNRLGEGQIKFRRAGENLALARSVSRAHKGLMESEGHRKNILDPNFHRVGIGVIDGGIYGKMFTQEFAD